MEIYRNIQVYLDIRDFEHSQKLQKNPKDPQRYAQQDPESPYSLPKDAQDPFKINPKSMPEASRSPSWAHV